MKMFRYDIPEICKKSIVSDVDKVLCYRITKNEPPIEDDFLPQLFFSPKPRYVEGKECDFAGISVFTDYKKIEKVLKRNKKLGKYIYSAEIDSHMHGPLKIIDPSKPFHLNWYQYKDVDATSLFSQKKLDLVKL